MSLSPGKNHMSPDKSMQALADRQATFISRHFTSHPATVGESYLEHLGFALRFSGKLGYAALAALLHALVPSRCETTASRTIRDLYAMIENRN